MFTLDKHDHLRIEVLVFSAIFDVYVLFCMFWVWRNNNLTYILQYGQVLCFKCECTEITHVKFIINSYEKVHLL